MIEAYSELRLEIVAFGVGDITTTSTQVQGTTEWFPGVNDPTYNSWNDDPYWSGAAWSG